MAQKILVIDDEESLRLFLKGALSKTGYETVLAASGEEALTLLSRYHFALVISDLRLPGISGIELLEEIKNRYPETEVIIITAYGSIESAVEAIKAGAADFLVKPLPSPDYVRSIIEKSFAKIQLQQKELYLDSLRPSVNFIAEDYSSQAALKLIRLVCTSDATVLLTGETGTGKEVAARTIHNLSSRVNKPFIAVNCASLPENLLESELFGYEKGAFTGALKAKPGKFVLADNGTLFLDEIAELPLALQAKLLRVIQEKELEPLGSLRLRSINVRIIVATNKDLYQAVAEGAFREDLYYRLNVFPIQLPPLRERRKDILPLAKHFLGTKAHLLSEEAKKQLLLYDYPGNVRELQNILERALILAQGEKIDSQHLLLPTQRIEPAMESMEQIEREAIIKTLSTHNGHRAKTAIALGISVRALQYKIKKYGLSELQKLHQ